MLVRNYQLVVALLTLGVLLGGFPQLLVGQCTLGCTNNMNFTLDSDCALRITYDMILNGEEDPNLCGPNDPANFAVSVMLSPNGPEIPTSPVVDESYVGQLLYVRVTHVPSGNFCTGSFNLDAHQGPGLTCPPDIQVDCGVSLDTSVTGAPNLVSCLPFELTFDDAIENMAMMCNPVTDILTRTWTLKDNMGQKTSCEQVIEVLRPSLDEVVFPSNWNGVDRPTIDCENPVVDPDSLGWPSVNGQPIDLKWGLCGLSVTYGDQLIDECGGSFSILRSWTVVDPCIGVRRADQLIVVKDTKVPQINCPDTLRVDVYSLQSCTADIMLPPATATDNCSGTITYSVSSMMGNLSTNGGLLTGLPLGFTTVQYQAMDACGLRASCSTVIEVYDEAPPVILCEDELSVSLTDNGQAIVDVSKLVKGVTDNCCPVTITGRRMERPNDPFTTEILLTCEDLIGEVMILVKATDCFGNSNFCMVPLNVEDKLDQNVECPDNIRILCTQDVYNLALTLQPTFKGACPGATMAFVSSDVSQLTTCGTGRIIRSWRPAGKQEIVCVQTITIIDPTPLVIQFPPDYTTSDCYSFDALQPDQLPAPFNAPVVNGANDCNLLKVESEDDTLMPGAGSCLEIRRIWTITDLCNNDPNNPANPMVYRDTQIIRINDTQPPQLSCPDVPAVSVEAACLASFTIPPPTIEGECLPDQAQITLSGDLGPGFFKTDIPIGVYRMTYSVTDICGNSSTCDFRVRVEDQTPPDANCISDLVFELDENGEAEIWANDFNAGSLDNCTPQNGLEFRMGPHPPFDTEVPPFDAFDMYTCADIGLAEIAMWVGDQAGNWSYCKSYIQVIDPLGVCAPASAVGDIAGQITSMKGDLVKGVEVSLLGGPANSQMMSNNGKFAFRSIQLGSNYKVQPHKADHFQTGLTVFDLVLLRQHLTGVKPLLDPYKLIAADIDGNGRISIFDAVLLQKLILNLQPDIPNNRPWRFIPRSYQFNDPANAQAEPFPEFYDIRRMKKNVMDVDFIAVKTGDINQSYEATLQSAHQESAPPEMVVLPAFGTQRSTPAFYNLRAIPNPFRDETTIEFDLPKPQKVDWQLWNVNGQIIDRGYWDLSQGAQGIRFTNADIPQTGIFMLQLRTSTDIQTIRLVHH